MSCCCNKKVVLLNDINTTNTWLNGAGVPAAGLGNDGDYYLDDSTGDYYNKVTGAWVLQGNLEGPAGAPGISTIQISGTHTEVIDLTYLQSQVIGGLGGLTITDITGSYTFYQIDKKVFINLHVEVVFDAPLAVSGGGANNNISLNSIDDTLLPTTLKQVNYISTGNYECSDLGGSLLGNFHAKIRAWHPSHYIQMGFPGLIPAGMQRISFDALVITDLN